MKAIAILLRALQFFAHRAHNDVRGATFFSDHSFLGDLYSAYEDAFDSVVERMIGLGMKPDIAAINSEACKMSAVSPNESDPKVLFGIILKSEEQLDDLIHKEVPKSTDGVQNLLQGLADESEARQYKLKQRLA